MPSRSLWETCLGGQSRGQATVPSSIRDLPKPCACRIISGQEPTPKKRRAALCLFQRAIRRGVNASIRFFSEALPLAAS